MKRKVGINCFGLNDSIHNDFEKTFSILKEIGFSSIEPMITFPEVFGMNPDIMHERLRTSKKDGAFWPDNIAKERIAYLRNEGFIIEGIHIALVGMSKDGFEAFLNPILNFVKDNNIKYVVYSPQKDSIEGIKKDVEVFKKGIKLFKDNGVELLFHQHYQEFNKDNGETPFEYILREVPDLRIELDVGWLKYVDVNILDIINKYEDRIAIIHLKDLIDDFKNHEEKDIFTAIGEGSIPLKEIVLKGDNLNSEYTKLIIDQDNSRDDMMKDLILGFHNIQNINND